MTFAQGFYERWAEGDVRSEMAVDHVEVNPVRPGRDDVGDFLAETGEVGSQNRGRDEKIGQALLQEFAGRLPAETGRAPL